MSIVLSGSADPDLHTTLEEHLADILAAITEAHNDPRDSATARMHLFIHRRCLPKISHRIHMDKHIFIPMTRTAEDDPIRPPKPIKDKSNEAEPPGDIRLEFVLDRVVSEWERNATHSSSVTVSEWLEVDVPIPGVPSREVNGKTEYEWSDNTACDWIRWLSVLLKGIRKASNDQLVTSSNLPQMINRGALMDLTEYLGILSTFVSLKLNKILNIPPITLVLGRYGTYVKPLRPPHIIV